MKLLALSLALTAAACTVPTTRRATAETEYRVGRVLVIGTTSRTQLIESLGAPSSSLESGRVLTWRLRVRQIGLTESLVAMPRTTWEGVDINLVVVFDKQGIARRSSAIEMR